MQKRQPPKPVNGRQTAALALLRTERDKAYSNLLMGKMTASAGLERREEQFARALYYGVLERQITLDYLIGQMCGRSVEKLDAPVRTSLRMGVYQLLWMEGVTSFAAVNESVELTKWLGCKSASGFVNGVLRGMLKAETRIPQPGTSAESLSIAYSCPLWLVEKWLASYGRDNTERLLQSSLGAPPVYLRVNTVKTTREQLCERLRREQVQVQPVEGMEHTLMVTQPGGALEDLQSFREGLFHVQDAASQTCVSYMEARPGEHILDVCAAPGGKSFTIAQYMKNRGRLLSCDLHEKRAALIAKGAERLGLTVIEAQVADGTIFSGTLGQFDRVLCDVPCSGFGSMRRKPEVKYKMPKEIQKLPEIQLKILQNGANYLRSHGTLVYSTCTLMPEENQQVIEQFLKKRKEFCLIRQEHFFGAGAFDSDGFYVAVLKREEHH